MAAKFIEGTRVEERANIRWEDLLDRSKCDPVALLRRAGPSAPLEATIKESIESASSSYADWPLELQDWHVILAALLTTAIGVIAMPHESARAYGELIKYMNSLGIGAVQVRMASSEIGPVYRFLKDSSLSLPCEEPFIDVDE